MDAEELRQLQAPLKARYKADPGAGKVQSRAAGVLLSDRPACRIERPHGAVDAGLHPAAGGNGQDACSVDMLLEALVGCAGVTFNVVATAMGIPFKSVRVVVEGEADIRGAMGVAREVLVGVTGLRLRFEVDSTASDEQLALLIQQTERYCVVFQTLRQPPPVEISMQRVSG